MNALTAELRKPYAAASLVGLAVAGCLALLLLPAETLRAWTLEDGFFEIGTVVGYWLAALACLLTLRREPGLFGMSGALLFLFGARELDLHKAFTAGSILKSNYYLKADAPLPEKLIAAAVVLAIVLLVVAYLWRYTGRFRQRLRQRDGAAVSVAVLLGLMAVTKVIDRLPNVLKDDYGMNVPDWVIRLQMALEEPLEFVIPLLALLAIYQGRAVGWRSQAVTAR